MSHKKHTQLEKPNGGQFHSNEIGFIGAPCRVIQSICSSIGEDLKNSYSIGYVDADHHADENEKRTFSTILTDKIGYKRLDRPMGSEYDFRQGLLSCDIVLVNGNHFKTTQQIVIINSKKKDSLLRKLDRLNHVILIILDDDEDDIYPFLKVHLQQQELEPLVCKKDDPELSKFIERRIQTSISHLYGLVLDGGQSQRMGVDKGDITYHGLPQREYLAQMVSPHCEETFVSISPGKELSTVYTTIEDTFTNLGPYGAILSAFRYNPNGAYLTLPCDAPLLDETTILYLIENRNPQKVATCFYNPETDFPEPLMTIWEPRAYPILLQFLSMGYSCPRKVLINSDIELIDCPDPDQLFNANTPEDKRFVDQKIDVLSSK